VELPSVLLTFATNYVYSQRKRVMNLHHVGRKWRLMKNCGMPGKFFELNGLAEKLTN
jgi:hypothetical protein